MTTNIEKRIVLAEADPMSHMEMELTTAIQEAYENAVKNGFKGTISDWIKKDYSAKNKSSGDV